MMKEADRKYFYGPKGKQLHVQEWGDLDKPVVILMHGFPGCADHGRLMTSTPMIDSIRLIAMDRPGYGKSENQKKLTPMLFAAQIVDLLSHLNIDKVSILSVSGGAPFAMALATLLKDRVQKLSSVAGVAPLTLKNCRYMNANQKKAWMLSNLMPKKVLEMGLNYVWKANMKNIDELLFSATFSVPDQKVFDHPEVGPLLGEFLKNSLAPGPHGVMRDLKIYSKHWGFNFQDIKCPVTLWHGSADDVVHFKYAEDMKRNLPQAKYNFMPGEGHYSLPMNCRDAIISDLIA